MAKYVINTDGNLIDIENLENPDDDPVDPELVSLQFGKSINRSVSKRNNDADYIDINLIPSIGSIKTESVRTSGEKGEERGRCLGRFIHGDFPIIEGCF